MKTWKWILLGLILAGIVGGGIAYQQYFKPHADLLHSTAKAEMSAEEIYTVFDENESEANEKFLDEVIDVEGTVKKINIESDKSIVQLETSHMMGGVICEFEAGALKEIPSEGDVIRVRGICTGKLMDVVLVRCILLNNKKQQ